MPVGRLLYRLRAKFGDGLGVAYYRDIVRPRILQTPPVRTDADGQVEIHALTSEGDWLNLIWALKSFYRYSGRRYPLCIHDDGSLTRESLERLRAHFPVARYVTRGEADAEVIEALRDFPRCRQLREANKLSLKVFDFGHYLRAERLMLLDSDVLFFAEPTELLRRLDDPNSRLNAANEDIDSAYTVEPSAVRERLGFQLVERFNSGLGLIHRESLQWNWMEEFLALPGIVGHFWRIEQTLFALASSRHGVELLPREYSVRVGTDRTKAPCRHYVGAVRALMYSEGLSRLVRQGILNGNRGRANGQ